MPNRFSTEWIVIFWAVHTWGQYCTFIYSSCIDGYYSSCINRLLYSLRNGLNTKNRVFSLHHHRCSATFLLVNQTFTKSYMVSKPPPQPPPQPLTLNLSDLSNPNNPYRLETSDNPSTLLVTEPLTTENYSTWSRSIQRALRAKNKLGFIDGTIDKPASTSPILLSLWERCNNMLVSWLQNAISLPLRPSVAFVDDARELWLELQDRFSPQNGPCIYELKKTLANLSQETDTVSTYYGKLKSLWDELSLYDPLPVCSCASTKVISDRY